MVTNKQVIVTFFNNLSKSKNKPFSNRLIKSKTLLQIYISSTVEIKLA